MIGRLSHMGVWVRDQDEARDFYTEKLGFAVVEDVTMDEFGGFRWLTVAPPGQPDLVLILLTPGPPAMDAETAAETLALVAKGGSSGGVFHVDDCRGTVAELQARGVEITEEPQDRFYGVDAGIRDPSGNLWRLTQPLGKP